MFIVFFTLLIFSQGQIVDQRTGRQFITPFYNYTNTSIFNQGRYDSIKFFTLGSYEYYAYFGSPEYSLFLGPIQPVPDSSLYEECTLGLMGINNTKYPNALRETWANQTFCSAYFCNNDTGINNYFLYYALNNPSERNINVVYHYSIINMCMLCKITQNQTDFINLINTNKSQCGVTDPTKQISFCSTGKCGNDPSQNLCIFTHLRSVCYNWNEQRYLWAVDSMHNFFVFYVFFGNVLTIILFLPLVIFTFFFICIPAVYATVKEVMALKQAVILDNICWTYTRKIFSLYNQACFNLLIAESICVLFSIIDFGSWYKLYPISLFINFFFTILCFINLTGMLAHGTDTQRSMQNLPLAPKFV